MMDDLSARLMDYIDKAIQAKRQERTGTHDQAALDQLSYDLALAAAELEQQGTTKH